MATTESPAGDKKFLDFPTSCAAPVPRPEEPVRVVPLAVAGVLAAGLTAYVWAGYGAKFGVLLLLGLGLGLALFHSRFGFTSAWRQLIAVGNGQGLRAHTLLLGTAATLIALIAGTGSGLFGSKPAPTAGALGLALFVGATLFAIGMQLGGACASGTLFAVGSGQSTIVLTLGGFIAGSVLYTWAYPVLSGWPEVKGVLLADHVGWFGSWAITIAVLAAIVLVTRAVQRRRTPPPTDVVPTARGFARVFRGSWPMLVGAVVLGVLAGAVFLVSGGIWGVTSAFSLWGAKILQVFGLHPETWEFWQQKSNATSLANPIWKDKTSLTDIGIMIGAAVAAAAAGAWKIHSSIPWRTAVAAILGGVLMGVGARMAGGCNIGAYLGGISTGSVHGWLWGVFALGGTWLGLKLRPLFGLANPVPTDSVC
ncbi:YeeE/YedE family protein [Amycolatopsis sp. SID8362]|uniref:YeeE/YedE family protein n=1 Tax=Amycolatopsis sp. SID8362 TaxID=2690346 RepID=UPI00136E29BF|nr:YeeE/YedE family protein [Amycolatopsis sp. SID8362]NBH11378.1 YeeE/YedE family protein [Amycolatopsis sp. SID8362]NED48070.1 YeeE/YedE family protein [Amycolatopsis sp. SID8362]